jgi:carboxylesterase type B
MLPPSSHTCPHTTSEDCLFVTLFTPTIDAMPTPAPILVWFHGGNFFQGHGGGRLYDGTHYANSTGTIVVSVNYRLGALGFLGGDNDIHGNYGFLDQVLALKWIQNNAHAFGGDPNRVTIAGQSAGAISVTLHLMSAGSKGLFQRAIVESSPITLPMRDHVSMPPLRREFAELVGCGVNDAACMRGKSADDVLEAQLAIMKDPFADPKWLQMFLPWTPYVDGTIVPMQPLDALCNGAWDSSIPVIMGTVHDETTLFIYEAFQQPLDSDGYTALLLNLFTPENAARVEEQYPAADPTDTRPAVSTCGTDYIFICVNRNVTRNMAPLQPRLWLYDYTHVASFSHYIWGQNMSFCWDQVCHGVELPFVFNTGAPFVTYTPDEVTLGLTLINYWANFAHNGDPNVGAAEMFWPSYNATASMSLSFGIPNTIEQNFQQQKCDFWDTVGYNAQ